MSGRLGIDDVSPLVSCGRYPGKAVVGEHIPVRATVWREGHDAIAATVSWRGPGDSKARRTRMRPDGLEPDRWIADIVPDTEGLWTFRVDAWSDPWATWVHTVEVKVAAGQQAGELANDLEIGARLLERVGRRPDRGSDRKLLVSAARALRDEAMPLSARIAEALAESTRRVMHQHPVRELVTKSKPVQLWVDRKVALYGSWYEFFPRSTGGLDTEGKPVHGTFKTATKELDRVAAMGFDIVYLPPIHPIGEENRKGRNNSVVAEPGDVGSTWAIGSADGGHDAIHPELGTFEDFRAFVARARELDMEIALDFALQCAPDHPWVIKHPDWFTTRPDGTIAYAENPPKKYQDIYPVNFDNDPEGLYAEVLRVVLMWAEQGVRVFRVDNPHTKPPDFWEWLIRQVKAVAPDVLFLSEAFTRPARLYGLAKLGFTQSYTYFTWRTAKQELVDFGVELVEHADEARPNLFVNTPDILHESLQVGGPAMFAIRAALAATLSPTWGVYAGFELYEHEAVRPGSEEYLDSEKYELRPRDFAGALAEGRSLQPWITRLNAIRRAHPALQQLRTLRFHHVDNDALIAYSKTDPETGDTVVVLITLDPRSPQEGVLWLDWAALGLDPEATHTAYDEVSGQTWRWGNGNYVRLDPWGSVAHIVHIRR
ncbi:alpha-1,4-glucan--maltose-1-phosphate maltosyltransferase [Actinokineospora globicatena]|uniref:alpha-1,4-glucan--maltose-1-phosphate maltosyltransferase n=1 Tax=Actinokineospora globicatena TaxID=103729 RepID=UPI0020A55599|nr:alpha-1,4-glucan--maltose-1-phosphate maltosyltransferase [Actinokineospora globicatena]MCP2305441.1 alpha-1,4-glucan:maltose-1-phosphate maltosyltransferase [Actinokineospora globicatena]GLW81309.1 alpha-1,4-glucan:maltose-1-phosphate maltosyltransferase [Actinokineospora globicatena]GLW87993.1 alpha-1,4-glucan:maltose-1-phosphate maltosyltransferase [Actinokineospora globicatena]